MIISLILTSVISEVSVGFGGEDSRFVDVFQRFLEVRGVPLRGQFNSLAIYVRFSADEKTTKETLRDFGYKFQCSFKGSGQSYSFTSLEKPFLNVAIASKKGEFPWSTFGASSLIGRAWLRQETIEHTTHRMEFVKCRYRFMPWITSGHKWTETATGEFVFNVGRRTVTRTFVYDP
jgi:hypothetical protein